MKLEERQADGCLSHVIEKLFKMRKMRRRMGSVDLHWPLGCWPLGSQGDGEDKGIGWPEGQDVAHAYCVKGEGGKGVAQ